MNLDHADKTHPESPSDNRVQLPAPDAENITVLTRELPNEPILPWHHFDSPWLNPDTETGEPSDQPESSELLQPEVDEDAETAEAAQLSLFEVVTVNGTGIPEDRHSDRDEPLESVT